ncbi:beta-lactamase-like protein [Mrakia frigida]|uniref:beta-lactamase-like protein n=1 Tax=Mrakia frigida TaxID=29902 RepID=UPI003FCBF699
MRKDVELTFLGTSSGGGPSRTRNCSSLAVSREGRACLVDCAEGTFRQLQLFSFKTKNLDTVFITHLHADHVLGLVPLLGSVLSGVANTPVLLARFKARNPSPKPSINIYGPSGLRSLVRTTLSLTSTQLGATYAVHELLLPGEALTSCSVDDMHLNEVAGRDLAQGDDGFWRDILREAGSSNGWVVDVGEIAHRVSSFGYILTFPPTPRTFPPSHLESLKIHNLHPSLLGKLLKSPHEPIELPNGEKLEHPGWNKGSKVAILGDTSDASGVRELARGVDLLVHECTNAHLPFPSTTTPSSSKKDPATFESVREKSAARGHSTPDVAGAFARSIDAKRVVLNHFSTIFHLDSHMLEIERQTEEAWGRTGRRVVCAKDGMRLVLRGVEDDEEDVALDVHEPSP